MNAIQFRKLALSFADTLESSHMGHPDFRTGGKIFATLGAPHEGWGMVKLTPGQQAAFLTSDPEAFKPCQGAWGAKGATYVLLSAVNKTTLKAAITSAYENIANC